MGYLVFMFKPSKNAPHRPRMLKKWQDWPIFGLFLAYFPQNRANHAKFYLPIIIITPLFGNFGRSWRRFPARDREFPAKKNPRPKSVQEAVPIAMDFVQPPPKHRLRRIMRCLRGCQDALLRRRRTGWLLAESAVLLVWSLNGCGTRPRLNHAAPASPHPRGFVLTGVPRREIQTRGVAGNRPGRPSGCEGTTGKKAPRRRVACCSHTCSAGCRIRLCSLV